MRSLSLLVLGLSNEITAGDSTGGESIFLSDSVEFLNNFFIYNYQHKLFKSLVGNFIFYKSRECIINRNQVSVGLD